MRADGKERPMADSRFVYVTYIRTTPEKLWAALTRNDFIRQYWSGGEIETDWKVDSPLRFQAERGEWEWFSKSVRRGGSPTPWRRPER